MDEKEEAIITSLIEKNLRFVELMRESQQKTGMSRQTFLTRLEDLRKKRTVGYKKPFYFLNVSKSRIVYDKRKNTELGKIEEGVEKLPSHLELFYEGYSLLVKIFRVYYLPTKFDEICSRQFYDHYESMQCKNRNEWCEKLIKKIIFIMNKQDRLSAQKVVNSVELELEI